jgi:selenocysteine lyase/cysteine desulfurase
MKRAWQRPSDARQHSATIVGESNGITRGTNGGAEAQAHRSEWYSSGVKQHFQRSLSSAPERLHFAAHSHHLWPDVSFEAQQQAWLDAARLADHKWDHIFATVWPAAQNHVAREVQLPDARTVVFAPNTHEFVVRILSCLRDGARIVTSDSEFHSFERQTRRLEEEGLFRVERVASEPFASFGDRLLAAARREATDLVFFSHVFFNSGAIVRDLDALVRALPADPLVVVDGYHGFCAVPTNFGALADRAFYVAGGYKYAMSGEGACFLHVPSRVDLRPRNTGWFAAFGALQEKVAGRVPFASAGMRFMGATFDPTALYRFDAVMSWRDRIGLTTAKTRAHAHALQQRFVEGLSRTSIAGIDSARLVVPIADEHRGQFLTFRTPEARAISDRLDRAKIVTDARDDRLRFGFGVYQDESDVDALLDRASAIRVD